MQKGLFFVPQENFVGIPEFHTEYCIQLGECDGHMYL